MFFEKQTKTHSPSIHEMRMEQMFSSSSYKKEKKKKSYDFNFFSILTEKAEIYKKVEISKKGASFLKKCIEYIRKVDLKNIDLFEMTPTLADDYFLYRKKREGKNKRKNKNFSFYEIDGTINYFKVFSGLFSENIYIRQKAMVLFEESIGDFVRSQVFLDYVSMIISCGIAVFLFLNIFFNISTFFKYYLNFLF